MEITLNRTSFNLTRTIGSMVVLGKTYYTLEDTVRTGPKVYGQTAIDAGRYEVIISWSNRFQRRMPLLVNVPKFEGIRIHAGNTEKDTEGCILVGFGKTDGSVTQSQLAFAELFKVLDETTKHEKIWLTINDEVRVQAPAPAPTAKPAPAPIHNVPILGPRLSDNGSIPFVKEAK